MIYQSSTEAKTENKSEEAGVKPVSAASQLSEQEKRELRLKKFGAVTDDSKKEQRAKRFGGADGSKATTGETKSVDPEKLAKRAQRFGGNAVTESTADSNPSKEALENRAKRFGLNNSATNVPDEVLQKRKERFGAAEEDVNNKQVISS